MFWNALVGFSIDGFALNLSVGFLYNKRMNIVKGVYSKEFIVNQKGKKVHVLVQIILLPFICKVFILNVKSWVMDKNWRNMARTNNANSFVWSFFSHHITLRLSCYLQHFRHINDVCLYGVNREWNLWWGKKIKMTFRRTKNFNAKALVLFSRVLKSLSTKGNGLINEKLIILDWDLFFRKISQEVFCGVKTLSLRIEIQLSLETIDEWQSYWLHITHP